MAGGVPEADGSAFKECISLSKNNPYVLRLAFSAGIGGLLFDYDTGNHNGLCLFTCWVFYFSNFLKPGHPFHYFCVCFDSLWPFMGMYRCDIWVSFVYQRRFQRCGQKDLASGNACGYNS